MQVESNTTISNIDSKIARLQEISNIIKEMRESDNLPSVSSLESFREESILLSDDIRSFIAEVAKQK